MKGVRRELVGGLLMGLLVALGGCGPVAQLESARRALDAGNLEAAHQSFLDALREFPDNVEARQGLEAVRRQLAERAIVAANTALGPGGEASVPRLRAALARLDSARPYDPDQRLLGPTRTGWERRIAELDAEVQTRARQARAAMDGERFDVARSLLDQIGTIDPEGVLTKELGQEYTVRYGQALDRRVEALTVGGQLSEERFQQARELLRELEGLGATARAATLRATVEARETRWIQAVSEDDMRARRFYRAYLRITRSPRQSVFGEMLARLRDEGGRFYLSQARGRLERKETARAYLEAVKGLELAPDLPGLFEVHRNTRDVVLGGVQKYIAISAFGAPQKHPDLGPQFSDALISYLFRILPYGINIVEREKIDLLLAEQKREFEEVGRLLNVDLIVTGTVSLMNIDRSTSERQSTVRVKVGERREANPEYELFLKTYGERAREMTGVPPRIVSVPQYETYTYRTGKARVKGFASVSARIFDSKEGRITYAQEFNGKFEAEDAFQDAVDVAGIQGDALELPVDTEVLEKLRNQIVPQLAAILQKQFEKRERQYLEEARYHLSRRERDKAMVPLARGFIYAVKAKVPVEDPDFVALRALIVEESERDALAAGG